MSENKHIHVLSELYAHPIAHNIKWQDLLPGLTSIGIISDNQHLTRNGHTVTFDHAKHDTLDPEEIVKLRHFMAISTTPQNEAPDLVQDIVIAMDHHRAVIFQAPGTASQIRTVLHADETRSRELHKHPTRPPFSDNETNIDHNYYDAIVSEMSKAKRIVILGHGTGTSNATSQLIAKVSTKNPKILHRIAAVQRCDLEALSESQIVNLGEKLLNIKHDG